MNMLNEILLAIIQAATEFLPISSSGHLALISKLGGFENIQLIVFLHLASLLAVLIFLRREIISLITLKKRYRRLWPYLILATIPAAFFGFFFKNIIEKTFSSYFFISLFFLFSSIILFLTKFSKEHDKLNWKNSLFIGFFQVFALFPGVSRSGMTISAGLFSGLNKKEAVKFSFLLFIPIVIGANLLELKNITFQFYLIPFLICFLLSYFFIFLLYKITEKGYFWIFSIYNLILSIISFLLYLFS